MKSLQHFLEMIFKNKGRSEVDTWCCSTLMCRLSEISKWSYERTTAAMEMLKILHSSGSTSHFFKAWGDVSTLSGGEDVGYVDRIIGPLRGSYLLHIMHLLPGLTYVPS